MGSKPRYDWNLAAELYDKRLNDREIAEKLGCTDAGVYVWRKRNNLPRIGKAGPKGLTTKDFHNPPPPLTCSFCPCKCDGMMFWYKSRKDRNNLSYWRRWRCCEPCRRARY